MSLEDPTRADEFVDMLDTVFGVCPKHRRDLNTTMESYIWIFNYAIHIFTCQLNLQQQKKNLFDLFPVFSFQVIIL